ncbi:MAG: hypothetical protein ACI9MC_000791 [Kiritimatiellia bacterium]|jgi:hypothetical protein
MTTQTLQISLGDLINVLYEEYLEVYGDEDLASVAAAATINDMIANQVNSSRGSPDLLEESAA